MTTTRVERTATGSRRRGGALAGVGLALGVGLASGISTSPPPAAAQPPNRAGLIVQLGDGSVHTFCVAFPEPSITGDVLLRRSGLEVRADVSALGTTVCRIADTGCDHPREACWCRCRTLGADCTYWGYNTLEHTLEGDRWSYSVLGAAARVVRDGDVDGWAWGQGAIATGAAPPVMRFEDLCAMAAAAPAAAPRRTDPPADAGVAARRRGALVPPMDAVPGDIGSTESERVTSEPSPTDAASTAPRPTIASTDDDSADRAAPNDAGPNAAATDVGSRDRPPVRRAARDIVAAPPAAPSRQPGEPGTPVGAAADRAALAVYVALVVALGAAALWLRRAH